MLWLKMNVIKECESNLAAQIQNLVAPTQLRLYFFWVFTISFSTPRRSALGAERGEAPRLWLKSKNWIILHNVILCNMST